MFETIKNGNVYYDGVCLKTLADKYQTPLKITFLDIIEKRILGLKKSFDKSIKKNNYSGKFIYVNANKANYGKDEIIEALRHSDGLETSSYNDLLLTNIIFKHEKETKKIIVCNGYKQKDYLDEIIKINKTHDITDIIDSLDEYKYLKSKNIALKVGLRIHLSAQYNEHDNEPKNDRFGLMEDEVNFILKDIKNTKLILTTIHYHQRGFDYEKEKYLINFNKAFDWYIKAKKLYPSVINYDIGGGTPLPFEKEFDYDKWTDSVIKLLGKICKENNIEHPNIISENGKFSQKEATINLYKVVTIKKTDPIPWAFVDGSLMIALPEMFALGEPITVKPINDLNKKKIKVRLGGLTCDCDDVLYDKKKGYFEIPDSKKVYIGCLGTGSYQNSMNGKGGIHHCLLSEERDLISYIKNGKRIFVERNHLQNIKDICKTLKL